MKYYDIKVLMIESAVSNMRWLSIGMISFNVYLRNINIIHGQTPILF